MKRDPSRKLDPETMLALAKSRERQERRSVSYLIATAVLVLGLGVIGWFLWPEDPPRFTLVAYDAVAVPEESTRLHARVEPEKKDQHPKLAGLAFWFQITDPPRAETLATDANGSAALDWQAPKKADARLEFMVRHQHKANPKEGARDQGRVFIWPAQAKLLVVDVDHALTTGIESLAAGGNAAPTLRPGAVAALQSLASRYKVVYICAEANEPSSYKKLRTWLRPTVATALGHLSDGPLLGPPMPVGTAEMETYTISQIEMLKKHFPERAVGVAGRAVEAQMYIDAGWKSIIIGEANPAPPGASSITGWADLPKEVAH
jgi:hypothetical protein